MPEEKDYVSRVYMTLRENVDGFSKTEDEFRSAIKDKEYANKVYLTLKETIDGFDKTQVDFMSGLGKPSAAPQPGGGGGLPLPSTPVTPSGQSPFGMGSIAEKIGQPQPIQATTPQSNVEPQQVATPQITAPQELDLSGLPPLEQALAKGDRSSLAPKPQLAVPPEAMDITVSGKAIYNPLKDYQRRQEEIDKEDDVDRQTIKKKELWEDIARYSQEDNKEIEGFLKQATPQLQQMIDELDGIAQALQNPELPEDQRQALQMQGEELQSVIQNNAAEIDKLAEKYKSNGSLSAQLIKASKGLRYNDAAPFEITTKEIWNGTVPAILKSVGGVLESGARVPGGMPSLVNPETGEILNPTWLQSVGSAIITGANEMQGEYQSTDADISVLDDLNASNIGKLAGSVISSFVVAASSGGVGPTTQAVSIGSQIFGNVYEQAKQAGLSPEMAGVFAIVPSLVSAKLAPYGVESITAKLLNPSSKVALKEAIKNVGKEGGAKKALELGKEWAKNVLIEGATGATESAVQYGEEVAAQQLPNVDFGNDETLSGFIRAIEEGFVTEAAGGGALGLFLTARPRRKLSDIASSAIKDPAKEQRFFDDLKSLLDNQDITQQQFDQVTQSYEQAKAAASQVPPTVTNAESRTEATELILEQQELQAQIEQTNPAMVAPLEARLKEVNSELGAIAEQSIMDIGQVAEPREEKTATRKIKSVAQIVAETKAKKDRESRMAEAKQRFKEQREKGAKLLEEKDAEAQKFIQQQREQRDAEVEQIAAIRPDLSDQDVLIMDLPDAVDRTLDRMDANIPTDVVQIDEAIAALDKKFQELEAYKSDPKRTHTTEQIDEVIDLLSESKTELQAYKEKLSDYESAPKAAESTATEQRTDTQGKPETPVSETPAKAETAEAVTPTAQDFSAFEAKGKEGRKARAELRERIGKEAYAKMEQFNKDFEKTVDSLESEGKIKQRCK